MKRALLVPTLAMPVFTPMKASNAFVLAHAKQTANAISVRNVWDALQSLPALRFVAQKAIAALTRTVKAASACPKIKRILKIKKLF